jgi:hypothetical protein
LIELIQHFLDLQDCSKRGTEMFLIKKVQSEKTMFDNKGNPKQKK